MSSGSTQAGHESVKTRYRIVVTSQLIGQQQKGITLCVLALENSQHFVFTKTTNFNAIIVLLFKNSTSVKDMEKSIFIIILFVQL